MAVDKYCVQHSVYAGTAKSLVPRLCGLCVALEHDNNAAALKGMQQAIAGVSGVGLLEYGRAVQAWARFAWDAYLDLQPLAREWLARSGARPVVRR